MTTKVTTPYKVYHVLNPYYEIINRIKETAGKPSKGVYFEFKITPPGRTIGEIPVLIALDDIRAVEYDAG